MNTMKLLALGITFCLLGLTVSAEDKKDDNAKLVVGKWTVSKTHENGPPEGGLVEFTKDGKISVFRTADAKKADIEGTYKVDGKKLMVTFKMGDAEGKFEMTIDKLDDTTFACSNKEGKVELKKKK